MPRPPQSRGRQNVKSFNEKYRFLRRAFEKFGLDVESRLHAWTPRGLQIVNFAELLRDVVCEILTV